MPLALYTIKDSSISGVFVIFICSVWPMLINTAFGVAGVRREWLNVAKTLEVKPLRKAFEVILPAAAPTILTGMRISMGIAWLVIVAAEMLVGGTGIGYFVWNEWNNLSLSNVIFAILVIGVVGMLLDATVRAAAEGGDVCRLTRPSTGRPWRASAPSGAARNAPGSRFAAFKAVPRGARAREDFCGRGRAGVRRGQLQHRARRVRLHHRPLAAAARRRS